MRKHSVARTAIEMGLVGVTATQLWHHTYIEELAPASSERAAGLVPAV
jgi:hypothetical protein